MHLCVRFVAVIDTILLFVYVVFTAVLCARLSRLYMIIFGTWYKTLSFVYDYLRYLVQNSLVCVGFAAVLGTKLSRLYMIICGTWYKTLSFVDDSLRYLVQDSFVCARLAAVIGARLSFL